MADKSESVPENVPGRFYVDRTCIDCDFCRETAPKNFTRQDRQRYSFVVRQPSSTEEETACREAMDGCPVEAIGADGS